MKDSRFHDDLLAKDKNVYPVYNFSSFLSQFVFAYREHGGLIAGRDLYACFEGDDLRGMLLRQYFVLTVVYLESFDAKFAGSKELAEFLVPSFLQQMRILQQSITLLKVCHMCRYILYFIVLCTNELILTLYRVSCIVYRI